MPSADGCWWSVLVSVVKRAKHLATLIMMVMMMVTRTSYIIRVQVSTTHEQLRISKSRIFWYVYSTIDQPPAHCWIPMISPRPVVRHPEAVRQKCLVGTGSQWLRMRSDCYLVAANPPGSSFASLAPSNLHQSDLKFLCHHHGSYSMTVVIHNHHVSSFT